MKIKNLFGNKQFYKKVLWIAIPIMIQNGITNFVSMLDNIMVGQLGTNQMSGVSIVNQLMFVFNICIFGAISGAGIFVAQYYGKGDHDGIKYSFRFKYYVSAFVVIASIIIFIVIPRPLISLYLHDGGSVGNIEATYASAASYLRIMLFGMIPFTISQIYASTLRECGETILPMIAGIAAVLVNVVFNYIFIFGNFGAPKLGANGAAIATCIARCIEMAIIIIWTHRNKHKNPYIVGVYRSFYIPKYLVMNNIKKGIPLLFNEVFWSMSVAVVTQCYAYHGLTVIAALNISSTITNVFNVVFIALGGSVSIIVGQLLGANKIEQAKTEAYQLITFSVICCAIVALFMSIFASIFPEIYNTEAEVKELAKLFIIVSAIIMPINAFTHASYFTLRSGGKTLITFVFDSVFSWCLVIPIAYVLTHMFNLNIVFIFFIVQGMDLVKGFMGFFLLKSGMWLQNIVKE